MSSLTESWKRWDYKLMFLFLILFILLAFGGVIFEETLWERASYGLMLLLGGFTLGKEVMG